MKIEQQNVPSFEFKLDKQSSDVKIPLLEKQRSDLIKANIQSNEKTV